MSLWQQHDIESKVLAILRDDRYSDTEHHMGAPFLTAYQITLEFAKRHPETVEALGYPIGGLGTGERFSLSTYLARRLSERVNQGDIPVEGAFLSNWHLIDITFRDGENIITSSLTGTTYTLSMFRLRED